MDISNIQSKDLHIFHLSADNNIIYIEYCGGYEDNYYNTIEINVDNNTYISNIKDINKDELAKVLNKIFNKLQFNNTEYKQYNIIALWNIIKNGVKQIKNKFYSYDEYNNLHQLIDYIEDYITNIGELQINNLAKEYNNLNNYYIDKIINHYYLLYIQYSYQLFSPSGLQNENNTDSNPLLHIFYSGFIKDKDNYDPDDYILEQPDSQLIRQYLLFVQAFIFNITNDLHNIKELTND